MARGPVMQLSGARELREALTRGSDSLRQKATAAVVTSTFSATSRMRLSAPRDTGTLQRAIDGSTSGLSGRVTIDDSAYYWRMVEFGTIYQNAQPFIRPTAELERPDFERRMEDVAQQVARDFSTSRFL